MMSNFKYLIEDLRDMVNEHGLCKGLYYSDMFDWFYKLTQIPYRIYNYISRFYYYGKVGASETYDFDAAGIDNLIYAHIKRVRKFMDSDKTHLVWNSDQKRNKGLIRKLYEFEELCRRKCEHDDFNDHYYFGIELDKRGRKTIKLKSGECYKYVESEETKKAKAKALKKDEFIAKQRRERYYHLLQFYVAGFWD